MTLEAPVLKRVMLEASKIGCRLFRNNRGLFYTMDGRKVRAGLEADGASDLIGFAPITITPEMVGKTVAVIMVAETKKSAWKKPSTETERQQEIFINFIKQNGGIGFFINDPEQLKKRVDEYKATL